MAVRPDQPIKVVLECVWYFVSFCLVDQFFGGALNVAVPNSDQPIKIVLECVYYFVSF